MVLVIFGTNIVIMFMAISVGIHIDSYILLGSLLNIELDLILNCKMYSDLRWPLSHI